MYINVAILKETHPHERRVALVPAVADKLLKLGARLHMQSGAGRASNFDDSAYPGVVFAADRRDLLRGADVVLGVQAPAQEVINAMKEGSLLLSFLFPEREPALVQAMLDRKITSFAMERIPRITRAQAMDALSSQAALAGYYSVLLGATHLGRILPKITTAAGTIGPAKVLVMGLGVAGLEAVATAHRMGALVEGYDVRPATEEQALSLGAKFVETGVNASGKDGYARALTPEESAKVATVLSRHIRDADLVITTAAIPGKASPMLISDAQLKRMKPGSVIVDLSAEGGGNCEGTVPGQLARVGPVKIVAPLNIPSLLAEDASLLYAKNLFNLFSLMAKDNVINIDWADEILLKTVVTHAGDRKNQEPGAGTAAA